VVRSEFETVPLVPSTFSRSSSPFIFSFSLVSSESSLLDFVIFLKVYREHLLEHSNCSKHLSISIPFGSASTTNSLTVYFPSNILSFDVISTV
ncbi:hypothetical protein GBAR_LOCUS19491, partial [Geodia barretti]